MVGDESPILEYAHAWNASAGTTVLAMAIGLAALPPVIFGRIATEQLDPSWNLGMTGGWVGSLARVRNPGDRTLGEGLSQARDLLVANGERYGRVCEVVTNGLEPAT